jgi:hypothetical protein
VARTRRPWTVNRAPWAVTVTVTEVGRLSGKGASHPSQALYLRCELTTSIYP